MSQDKELLELFDKAINTLNLKHKNLNLKKLKAQIIHQMTDSDDTTSFDIEEESAGTKRFLSLMGPWLLARVIGETLIFDELDQSLHPILSRRLIQEFHSNPFGSNGAQLLFTTHDTTLLDLDLFRRDQIWFTEKNKGATELVPLTDYHPRNGEALQKGYLAGRYGAIPVLGSNLNFNDSQK
jgi:uncharacterized protein